MTNKDIESTESLLFEDVEVLTGYTKTDLVTMKENIKTGGLVFEAALIEALSNAKFEDGSSFDASKVIQFYLDKAQNAKKVNNKTGELVNDEDAQMKAMDKLLKIITGNNGATSSVNINVSTTNNNLFGAVPKPGEKLIY